MGLLDIVLVNRVGVKLATLFCIPEQPYPLYGYLFCEKSIPGNISEHTKLIFQ